MRAILTGAALMFLVGCGGGPLGPECKKLQDTVKKMCATPSDITKEMCADENIKKIQSTDKEISDMNETSCKDANATFDQLADMMKTLDGMGKPPAGGDAPAPAPAPDAAGSAPTEAPK
jgi:hypothetical protein